MLIIIILICLGMLCLVGFGGLVFNDEHKDWGITIFGGFLGFLLIACTVAYLLFKVYH